jgi:uncharacterized protein
MRIEVVELTGAGKPFAHTYGPEELLLDEESARLVGPVEVSGRVVREGNWVRLRGTISGRTEVECGRCLAAIAFSTEAAFNVAYITAADYAASETAELQADDLDFSVFDGESIDIDELVREQILLALPSHAICRDDCKGLCPTCGADLNAGACPCAPETMDPRWAALESLKLNAKR